jgi:hypothetical protein
VTLLGDAAHPMYPTGSNGSAQAILDARYLAKLLSELAPEAALAAYEIERLPNTAEVVRNNRRGGPERVLYLVAERAPNGFHRLEDAITSAEIDNIVGRYAQLTGLFVNDQGSSAILARVRKIVAGDPILARMMVRPYMRRKSTPLFRRDINNVDWVRTASLARSCSAAMTCVGSVLPPARSRRRKFHSQPVILSWPVGSTL